MSTSDSEETFLKSVRTLLGDSGVTPGDDCAIIDEFSPPLLATVDNLVESIHYESKASTGLIAQKLTRVNVSDIVAMGGNPRWSLFSYASDETASRREKFIEHLIDSLEQFGVGLSGGDVSAVAEDSANVLNLTIIGEAHQEGILTRNQAESGDFIALSGPLGGSAGALNTTYDQRTKEELDVLYKPEINVEFGQYLVDLGVRCAIDVSDGLLKDLRRLLDASGVGASLDHTSIPVHPIAQDRSENNNQALKWAIQGGEDYELLFALPPGLRKEMDQDYSIIGRFTDEPGLTWSSTLPEELSISSGGYDHFQ